MISFSNTAPINILRFDIEKSNKYTCIEIPIDSFYSTEAHEKNKNKYNEKA